MSNLAENENPALTTRLEGSIVVLEPLREEHAEGLWEAAQAPEIWSWLYHVGESRERFDAWWRLTMDDAASGKEGPFATRERSSGRLIGSSRYLNVRPADRVVDRGRRSRHCLPSSRGSCAST